MSSRLRGAGALLVLVSLALPLSRCESDPAGPAPPVVEYTYAWSELDAGDPWSWARAAAFLWPAAAVLYRRRGRSARGRRLLLVLEPVACLASALLLAMATLFEAWMLGTWLALAGLGLYLAGWAAEVLGHLARRARPPARASPRALR